jgi:hypothetical protein
MDESKIVLSSYQAKASAESKERLVALMRQNKINQARQYQAEQIQQQHNQAWQCLATGLAGIVIGGCAYHALAMANPTPIIEKPVIVEKQLPPVIVERNCIAFCGN